jgi:energy-converting hydrogenase Eha subunit E
MSKSNDDLPDPRTGDSLRDRLVRGLGGLDTDSSGFVLIFLAFFAPGLAIVGFAAAADLTASLLLRLGGALLGVCASLAVVRDFLRWQVSWLAALLTVAFVALLLAAYL